MKGLITKEYYTGLGSKEAFLLRSIARADKNIFSIDDAKKILPAPKKIISGLVKKKWVLPLKRGLYALVPLEIGPKGADSYTIHNFTIPPCLCPHYYIGYWSALNYHGLTDQIPSSTFVATLKSKKPLDMLASRFYFVKITEKKFFGFMDIEIDGANVKISDPNKTIADCLDHPEYAGGIWEIAKSIFFNHNELDVKKIIVYGRKMGNSAIIKRLGFILDRIGLLKEYSSCFKGLKLSKGFCLLDTILPKRGRYVKKWGVIENIDIDPGRWFY